MMKLRHVAVLGLGTLALGACKKKAPPAAPPPAEAPVDSAAIRAEQARADSIAAAQRAAAAREAEARAHAAAIARVREDLASVVYFDYDSDALSQEAQDKLRAKAEIMRTNPSLTLRVEGNADQRGTEEYNLALGQRRAQSVKNFIVQYGVAPERISIISYGEERPAVEGENEAAYAKNRRAEFVVTGGEIANLPSGVQ